MEMKLKKMSYWNWDHLHIQSHCTILAAPWVLHISAGCIHPQGSHRSNPGPSPCPGWSQTMSLAGEHPFHCTASYPHSRPFGMCLPLYCRTCTLYGPISDLTTQAGLESGQNGLGRAWTRSMGAEVCRPRLASQAIWCEGSCLIWWKCRKLKLGMQWWEEKQWRQRVLRPWEDDW